MTASTPYNADSNRPNTSLLIKYATSQSQAFPAGNCSSPLDLQPLAARNLSRAQPATRAPGATIGPWMGQHEADWITRPQDAPTVLRPPPRHLLSTPHPATAITLKSSLWGKLPS